MIEQDIETIITLAGTLKSVQLALAMMSGSVSPIIHVEGLVDRKISTTRLTLHPTKALDSREEFLKSMSAALEKYQTSIERELKSLVRPNAV